MSSDDRLFLMYLATMLLGALMIDVRGKGWKNNLWPFVCCLTGMAYSWLMI